MKLAEKINSRYNFSKMTALTQALNKQGSCFHGEVWSLIKDEKGKPVIKATGPLPIGIMFALGNCGIGLAGEENNVQAFVKMGVSENHYKRDTGLRYKKEQVNGISEHTIFMPDTVTNVEFTGKMFGSSSLDKAVFNVNCMYAFSLSHNPQTEIKTEQHILADKEKSR